VTLTVNDVVCPGATVLDPGFTERLNAYTVGIPLLMKSMEYNTRMVRAALMRFKTNHTGHTGNR
jgi:hypothetical protein